MGMIGAPSATVPAGCKGHGDGVDRMALYFRELIFMVFTDSPLKKLCPDSGRGSQLLI